MQTMYSLKPCMEVFDCQLLYCQLFELKVNFKVWSMWAQWIEPHLGNSGRLIHSTPSLQLTVKTPSSTSNTAPRRSRHPPCIGR